MLAPFEPPDFSAYFELSHCTFVPSIIDQLGTASHGCYGAVVLGTWHAPDGPDFPHTDIPIAVKILDPESTTPKEWLKEIQSMMEIRSLNAHTRGKKHLAIVYGITIYTTPTGIDRCAVALELLGRSLESRIKVYVLTGTRPPLHLVLDWLVGIALGLEALHDSAKIIHGDLKLDNIMLVSNDVEEHRCKLIDFGYSKTRAGDAAIAYDEIGARGCRTYRAPELLAKASRANTKASDIYALGLIMWNVLACQTLPYGDVIDRFWDGSELKREFWSGIIDGTLRPSEAQVRLDAPRVLKTLMASCWEGTPELRPTARAVAEELAFIRDAVRIPALVHTLHRRIDSSPDILDTMRIFVSLVEHCSDNRAAIVHEGGIPLIVEAGLSRHRTDAAIATSACKLLGNIAECKEFVDAVIAAGALPGILAVQRLHIDDAEASRWACSALSHITVAAATDATFIEAGVVTTTIYALAHHTTNVDVARCSCRVLSHFVSNLALIPIIIGAGGVQQVVAVLLIHPAQPQLALASCQLLGHLSADPHACDLLAAEPGAITGVVAVLTRHPGNADVIEHCCRLLANVTSHPLHSHGVTKAGGIPALAAALASHMSREQPTTWCCNALHNLSTNIENIPPIVEVDCISLFVAALAHHGANISLAEWSCGALSNMTVLDGYRSLVAQSGAISHILGVMKEHRASLDLFRAASIVLERTLSSARVSEILAADGVSVLCDGLAAHATDIGVVRSSCVVLANLVRHRSAMASMMREDVIASLMVPLATHGKDCGIVVGTCIVLQHLCAHRSNCDIMVACRAIPLLVSALAEHANDVGATGRCCNILACITAETTGWMAVTDSRLVVNTIAVHCKHADKKDVAQWSARLLGNVAFASAYLDQWSARLTGNDALAAAYQFALRKGAAALVCTLRTFTVDPVIASVCIRALGKAAVDVDVARAICTTGAIPLIVSCLKIYKLDADIALWGCRAIGNLAAEPACRTHIVAEGAFELVVAALVAHSHLENVVRCGCYAIVKIIDNDELALPICPANCIPSLIAALSTHKNSRKVCGWASHAISVLADAGEHRPEIAVAGAIPILLASMATHPSDATLIQWGCRALYLLVPHVDPEDMNPASHALSQFAAALSAHGCNVDIARWSCQGFEELASKLLHHDQLLQCGAIPLLVAALEAHMSDKVVVRCCCKVILQLVERKAVNETALAARTSRVLVAALHSPAADLHVLRTCCQALSMLAADVQPDSHDDAIIPALVVAVTRHTTDGALVQHLCLATAELFWRAPKKRLEMVHHGVISAVLTSLDAHKMDVDVVTSCCRVLDALLTDKVCCSHILAQGGVSRIITAMMSDARVQAPALSLLVKIAGHPPYRSDIASTCATHLEVCIRTIPTDCSDFRKLCELLALLADTESNRNSLIDAGIKRALQSEIKGYWPWQAAFDTMRAVLDVLGGG